MSSCLSHTLNDDPSCAMLYHPYHIVSHQKPELLAWVYCHQGKSRGGFYLGDSRVHPHQKFINLIKIFLSLLSLTVAYSGGKTQQRFRQQLYTKQQQQTLLVTKTALTNLKYLAVLYWGKKKKKSTTLYMTLQLSSNPLFFF